MVRTKYSFCFLNFCSEFWNFLHSTRMIFLSEISCAVNEIRIFNEVQFQSKLSELPAISTMSSELLLERSNMP